MPPIQLAERLALLLALAFFLGLAFEEVYKRNETAVPGGVRTFPLVALGGALLYLVEPHHAFAYCVGLLALAAWISIFLRVDRSQPGTSRTLVIPATNLLVYAIGPVALTEPVWVSIGATVAAVLLVGRREEMHGFARLVPPDEILTAGKFLILAGIILPLIPDIRLIPAAPLTPYRVWLAVVAISGLSYLTYLVQRYLPVKGGALFPALLGGAYSSTAATVVLAKRQREAAAPRAELSAGIVAATMVMYLRLAIVVALFSRPLAASLAPALALLFAAAGLLAWWEWRRAERGNPADLAIPAANPLQLTTALVFAALFVAISLATVWVEKLFGRTGIFTLAAVVGASDIDPFVLNLAQGGAPGMSGSAVSAAILIAASANNLAKSGYAIGFGSLARTLRPALMLTVLAVLGFAAAAAYLV
ncbi:MAG TPA: DUF4010 domain-containing protein [Stellaceae bacterium]|jgi:uncharacterized membrane protein (DUF4010 family)|nr:DUF4010 domain-containing protein [Stellaceae bacterium]